MSIDKDGISAVFQDELDLYLYCSWACPYSHRVLAALHVTELIDEVMLVTTEEIKREHGWSFAPGDEPLFNARTMKEVYIAAKAEDEWRPSVPLLIDGHSKRIVSDNSATLTRFISQGFGGRRNVARSLGTAHDYPAIDDLAGWIHDSINRGVYRVGLADDQQSYERQAKALFAALDIMDERLSNRPYLCGNTMTEADLFLYATLVRFDPIYFILFRCSLRRIADYPHLSKYLARLDADPALIASTNIESAKKTYFKSVIHRPDGIYHPNPSGIVPL